MREKHNLTAEQRIRIAKKWKIAGFPSFSYPSTWEIPASFYILARTFQAEPPRIDPCREYPPPHPRAVCDCFKNTGDNCTPAVLQYSFLEKV